MASHTLKTSDRLPSGTTVTVYEHWTDQPTTTPVGAVLTDGLVGADGSVTFDELADDTEYFAYAQVNGARVYVAFRTPPPTAQSGEATVGYGEPSALLNGASYFETDANGHVIGEWVGTGGNPVKVAALQGPLYGTLAAIPAASSVPDGQLYVASDQSPKQIHQAQAGTWVRIV